MCRPGADARVRPYDSANAFVPEHTHPTSEHPTARSADNLLTVRPHLRHVTRTNPPQ